MMALQLYRAMCWPWLGAKRGIGYGQIWIAGKKEYVHRMAWLAFKGPIPEGMDVLHTCDNPICRHPDHLWTGTHADNMMDKTKKGRFVSGRRKLSPQEVSKIRVSIVPHRQLALEYGVSRLTIWRIRTGVSYQDIP